MPYRRRDNRTQRPCAAGWEIFLALTVPFAPCTAADAAEAADPFDLSPEQLFAATVMSASKSEQRLFDAPAAIYVLSNEDILRSGATSIPELLRIVPGVQVAKTGASGWAVSVRGFNSGLANKLLVLIDGREVYDSLYSGVYWDAQDTVLEDIERIEVIRGPGATLWGANAVNGVINIITKKAADTQGNLVSALAGNQERGIVSARHGGTLGESGHWRAYAKYLNRDNERTFSDLNARDEWDAKRGGFRADWKTAAKDDVTLQGDVYRLDAQQYRFLPFAATPFSRLQLEKIPASGANILGRWTRTLPDKAKLSLQSYLDYAARDQLLLQDRRISFDTEVQYELPPLDRHELIVGGRYHMNADQLSQTTVMATFTNGYRNDHTFSVFAQDKITLEPERWFLTLGSKFEHNGYTGFEYQPNARLQWHPNEQQTVWASAARAVRTPSRLETNLFLTQATGAGPLTLNTIGIPTFDSEDLVAYELGYRHQLTPKFSIDTAVFYNEYSHLSTLILASAVLPPSAPPYSLNYVYTNDTTARTRGIEATANWRAWENLNLSSSYSLLNISLHGPPAGGLGGSLGAETAEKQSPQHQFNLRSEWNVTPDHALDATLYRTSALADFAAKAYWRADLRWGWKINDGLQFNLVGQNLFSRSHREFTSPADTHVIATEAERSFYGQFVWRF